MKNYIIEVFASIVSLGASYGGVKLFIIGMQYLKTKTKSSNLKLALDWGIGAVTFAEQFIGTGQEQKLSAINALRQRLDKNNKLKNFTDEQIEQIIQQAYAQAKANGLIEAVKHEEK